MGCVKNDVYIVIFLFGNEGYFWKPVSLYNNVVVSKSSFY